MTESTEAIVLQSDSLNATILLNEEERTGTLTLIDSNSLRTYTFTNMSVIRANTRPVEIAFGIKSHL